MLPKPRSLTQQPHMHTQPRRNPTVSGPLCVSIQTVKAHNHRSPYVCTAGNWRCGRTLSLEGPQQQLQALR